MLKVLDLFSGIGGFSLGLHRAGMETVAFCEIEPYPQAVLQKNFPGVPIYDDVRTITAERLRTDGINRIDLVCGGFPCQPFSVAGKQQGTGDHRHLWPEMFRIIQETKPTWVIGENVAGFVSMALCEVSADLEGAGYEVQPFIIPACAVNAPHRRDRVWIVAHSVRQHDDNGGHGTGAICRERSKTPNICVGENDCDSNGSGCEKQHITSLATAQEISSRASTPDVTNANHTPTTRQREHGGEIHTKPKPTGLDECSSGKWWATESPFCGVADGIPKRVDRLKCLGNAVVPQIPEIIGRAIMAADARVI